VNQAEFPQPNDLLGDEFLLLGLEAAESHDVGKSEVAGKVAIILYKAVFNIEIQFGFLRGEPRQIGIKHLVQ